MPHDHRPRARRLAQGARRSTSSRRSPPPRRRAATGPHWAWEDRAAVFLKAARAADHDLAVDAERRHDARPVEDRVPGRDRRRVRADRLLAVQPALRAGAVRRAAALRPHDVEPARLPPARGVRLRGDAVQLHRHRRQPADRAGADGQHRRLEAGVHRRCSSAYYIMQLLEEAGLPPGRDQLRAGRRGRDLGRRRSTTATSPACTSRAAPRSSTACGRRSATNMSRYRVVPAHRRRDRRQGLHRRARLGRRRRRSPWRSRAAGSSTRGRSARRRAASTSRARCGTTCAIASVAIMNEIKMGDVRRLPQLHGRGDRPQGLRPASAATSTTRGRTRRSSPAARPTDEEGYFIEPDARRDRRRRATACCARRSSARWSPRTSTTTTGGWRRCATVDATSPYALTGAVFAQRPRARCARRPTALRNAAGNFYVNDKPTGAVVGPAAVRRRARRRARTTRRDRS